MLLDLFSVEYSQNVVAPDTHDGFRKRKHDDDPKRLKALNKSLREREIEKVSSREALRRQLEKAKNGEQIDEVILELLEDDPDYPVNLPTNQIDFISSLERILIAMDVEIQVLQKEAAEHARSMRMAQDERDIKVILEHLENERLQFFGKGMTRH